MEILKQNWNIHANDLIIDEDHNEKQENYLESEENSKHFFNKYVLILVQLFLKQCYVDYDEINAFVFYLNNGKKFFLIGRVCTFFPKNFRIGAIIQKSHIIIVARQFARWQLQNGAFLHCIA